MSFSALQLDPSLLKAITECGYTEPTPIQSRAIPEALAGRDLIASAQTGTGKTAAFMLPALQRLATLVKGPKGAPRVLVLTPTRELAAQVTEATRTYGRFLRIRSAVILGGVPYGPQFRDLSQPIDLVVATPGRLLDHLDRGSLDLSRLELLILDEADRMLDMGFKEDVEKVCAAAPKGRQTLLFTATMDATMARLAASLLHEPVRIEVTGKQTTHEQIEQRLHLADNLDHKQRLLERLVSEPAVTRAIIFAGTRRDAERLAGELSSQGHRAHALHGEMNQVARNRTVDNLRKGRVRLLVATDVAARGLDVKEISHVINFDLPKFAEDYVHRIGRTGRAGASGTAISFASSTDYAALQRIQRFIGQQLPQHVLPGLEPTCILRAPAEKSRRRPGGPQAKTRRPFADREKTGAGSGYQGKSETSGSRRPTREPVVTYRSGKPSGKGASAR